MLEQITLIDYTYTARAPKQKGVIISTVLEGEGGDTDQVAAGKQKHK